MAFWKDRLDIVSRGTPNKDTLSFEGTFYKGVLSGIMINDEVTEEFVSECGKVFRNSSKGWIEVNQDLEKVRKM